MAPQTSPGYAYVLVVRQTVHACFVFHSPQTVSMAQHATISLETRSEKNSENVAEPSGTGSL